MRAELERMVDAHRRTLDHLATGVAIFGADQPAHLLQHRLPCRSGTSTPASSTSARAIPPCSTGCATRAGCRSSRTSASGRPSCTRPIARPRPRTHEWHLPDGRTLARRHHAQSGRRRDLSLRRHHRAARAAAALRGADPRAGRDARQPGGRRRGVRERRAAAAVQSGVRADVEVRSGRAAGAPAYRGGDRLVPRARRRQPDLAGAAHDRHRDRRPRAGDRRHRAARRQRGQMRDRAAAGRRHAGDVPGHHRLRQRRARAARAQRGAGGRRQDQDRFRPPRLATSCARRSPTSSALRISSATTPPGR